MQKLENFGKSKKFQGRIFKSKNDNNGQSLNWRQDWWMFNNVSYAKVVKNSVTKPKGNQVENYPWKPRVNGKTEIESYDNNRAFQYVNSHLANVKVTPRSEVINKAIPAIDVNFKHRNLCGKSVVKGKLLITPLFPSPGFTLLIVLVRPIITQT